MVIFRFLVLQVTLLLSLFHNFFQHEQESHMAENLVSTMQPKLRDRYLYLKHKNMDIQVALKKMNRELN